MLCELLAPLAGADVVRLVRSGSATAAERFLAAMPKLRERDDRRIDIEAGDLSRPHFGLSADRWGRLADSIDTIYHCGARVHLLQTYDQLRTTT